MMIQILTEMIILMTGKLRSINNKNILGPKAKVGDGQLGGE